MSGAKRFESARRLSLFAVNKPDTVIRSFGKQAPRRVPGFGFSGAGRSLGRANLGLTEGDVCGAKRSYSALVPERKSTLESRSTSARNAPRPTTPPVGLECATSGAGSRTDLASCSGSLRGGLKWS